MGSHVSAGPGKERACRGRVGWGIAIMLKLLALAVAGALFAAICSPALAQGAAPQAMPQQQFDDLVNAITKSVLEKIRSEKPPAPTPPPASRSPFDAAN